MSFSQINQLRKAGQLRQAWVMARAELSRDSNDIWNQRAMAWVLYDYAKQNATFDQFDRFIKCLEQINNLCLPADETLFWEKITWLVRGMAATCQRNKKHQPSRFSQLLSSISVMPFPKPSESWSALLQTFLRLKNDWPSFPDFCRWWGFENLRPDDYHPSLSSDGHRILSLAERSFMAYSKALLAQNRQQDMLQWEPHLGTLSSSNPSYIYLPYYLAKIRIAIGKPQLVFDSMKTFVHKKRNEFWVWELLGDTATNPDSRFCLYSKAMTCPAKDEMMVNMREKIINELLQRNHFPQAKAELEHLLITRRRNNWNIPTPLLQMQQSKWYLNTHADNNIKTFYIPFAQKAENILLKKERKETITRSGTLRKTATGIAFLDDIYIPAHLTVHLKQGDSVIVSAVKAFDKKKNRWGWKAIKIQQK